MTNLTRKPIVGFEHFTIDIDGVIKYKNEDIELDTYKEEPCMYYSTEKDMFLEFVDSFVCLQNEFGIIEYRSIRRLVLDTFTFNRPIDPRNAFRYTAVLRNINAAKAPIKHYSLLQTAERFGTIPGFSKYTQDKLTGEIKTTSGHVENTVTYHGENYVQLHSDDNEYVLMKVGVLYCMTFREIPKVGVSPSRLQVYRCSHTGNYSQDYIWVEMIGH